MTTAPQSPSTLTVAGKILPLSENGYLSRSIDWSEAVAVALAQADGITLTETHWAVIRFLRNYYNEYDMMPLMRIVVAAMTDTLGGNGTSSALYMAFPFGPIRQGARYAGLPEPAACF